MTTYNEVLIRAKESALDILPELPAHNSVKAWQDFIDAIEAIDSGDAAHIEADSWDIVIYSYKAMELIQDCPISVLHEAESQWRDCGDGVTEGIYELASAIAYWIIYAEVYEAIESARDELLELAENQIEEMQ
jgi:hypothetical protein